MVIKNKYLPIKTKGFYEYYVENKNNGTFDLEKL